MYKKMSCLSPPTNILYTLHTNFVSQLVTGHFLDNLYISLQLFLNVPGSSTITWCTGNIHNSMVLQRFWHFAGFDICSVGKVLFSSSRCSNDFFCSVVPEKFPITIYSRQTWKKARTRGHCPQKFLKIAEILWLWKIMHLYFQKNIYYWDNTSWETSHNRCEWN